MSVVEGRSMAQKITAYGFGIDRLTTATALRKLADAFENGRLALQEASVCERVKVEDFPISTVTIRFAEMSVDEWQKRQRKQRYPNEPLEEESQSSAPARFVQP
jgi:hypothetical protein